MPVPLHDFAGEGRREDTALNNPCSTGRCLWGYDWGCLSNESVPIPRNSGEYDTCSSTECFLRGSWLPPLLKGLNAFFANKYPSLFVLDKLCERSAQAYAPIVASSKRECGHILLEFLIPMSEKFASPDRLKKCRTESELSLQTCVEMQQLVVNGFLFSRQPQIRH